MLFRRKIKIGQKLNTKDDNYDNNDKRIQMTIECSL